MTPPTTLTDEDYRAIARAARKCWVTEDDRVFRREDDGTDTLLTDQFPYTSYAIDACDEANGRAAVAEYERRKR